MTLETSSISAPIQSPSTLRRFEIRAVDPDGATTTTAQGQAVCRQARTAFPNLIRVVHRRVYLIEAGFSDADVEQIGAELLTDPINESFQLGASEADGHVIEIHLKPGVMDPVAQSTARAIAEMLPHIAPDSIQVATAQRFDFVSDTPLDAQVIESWCKQHLANPVIQDLFDQPQWPEAFPATGSADTALHHVTLTTLDDDALMALSREGHLFLDLNEMHALRDHYIATGREPTSIELETLAQTWSEHCVHKTLKATIAYTGPVPPCPHGERPFHEPLADENGNPVGVTIHNLLKATVAGATFHLRDHQPELADWLVSVFDDNAGIVRFDDSHGVCIKVETHNHPSAIEPYGGAATGIGGCIRDIMGTGLAAKPFASTDVFCVAPPTDSAALPSGVLDPEYVLDRVVAGVRDYGNRMGIPTINGAVFFDPDYVANPLVYCGCVGLIPLDKCFGEARPGDRIIAIGGATGRDGIHGATFSSDELTDTHADEFSHAVQIGNAITQKQALDVIIEARDHPNGTLFSAITDCGAGGFSSAVGEMAEKTGAVVTLETAPLKYQGLSPTEIWISEAQERMVMAVPPENVAAFATLCDAQDVTMCDLGAFGFESDGTPALSLTYEETEYGRLSMQLMHDGIPTPTREARWSPGSTVRPQSQVTPHAAPDIGESLHALLAHPNIASKHWIIRQYDHEVQAGAVVRPLVGVQQDGPSDASVVRPKLDSYKGIALGCGLAPHLSEKANARGWATDGDSYEATLHAIDEAIRNVTCVGADPSRIAILDNFCWARCTDPEQLGSLVRAAWACYDGALSYATPFVSGKDSLSNQFTTQDGTLITIPPTLLITAMGLVDDARQCITMDVKAPGNLILLVGSTGRALGGSHLTMLGRTSAEAALAIPRVDQQAGPQHARRVHDLIRRGLVCSAHDCSDGGLLVAAAEMAIAGRLGLDLDLTATPADPSVSLSPMEACFAESPSRYLLEVEPQRLHEAAKTLQQAGIRFAQIGVVAKHDRLTARHDSAGALLDESIASLHATWRAPLDH